MFVDINEELLFTSKGVDPTAHKGRGLQLKNKEAVKKYREVFWSKLLAHNIFQQCQALWETPTGANTSSLQTSIEAIDSKITRAALQAEREPLLPNHLAVHGHQPWQMQANMSPSGEIAYKEPNTHRTLSFILYQASYNTMV